MGDRDDKNASQVSYSRLPLNKFGKDVHSQHGEDGILAEIFRRLAVSGAQQQWCVEFGAWDGKHYSNTFALVENEKYRAVYIEGDERRFEDLEKTVAVHPSIIPIRAFVSPARNDPSSLNNLLAKTELPTEFALLSIDIDSFDLDVWESFDTYRPKVVVIEINSSVPPGILWRHGPKSPGATFSSTVNVAKAKGYELACHTGNLIFVRRDLADRLGFEEGSLKYPETLFLFESEWFPENLFARFSSRRLMRRLFRRRH